MTLFKYFKVDKRVKEDNSLGNSDAVLPSSSGSLTQTIIIMDKGTATKRGTYEKARVAKRASGYGVLSTVRHFSKIKFGQIVVAQRTLLRKTPPY